jgi:hypothetical protein
MEGKMNTSAKERSPNHSAIPSWSGFNYQGKVALYCALEFLNNRIGYDYSRYSLELEWYEDFAIKEEETYVSIHQVKSYKKNILSEYKDAIWNLLGKTIDNNIPESYLHTSEDIPPIKEIKEELIKLVAPSGDENEEFTPAYYHKIVTKNGKYDQAFQSFWKYQYHTGKCFCKLDEIDRLIKEKIEDYYKLQNRNETKGQIQGVFLNLLGFLNEHITTRHKKEQINGSKKDPILINLTDIVEVLERNWEEASQDYIIHQMKHSFFNNCESLIHTLYKAGDKDLRDINRVEEFVKYIILLENQQFLDFCKRITPHISVPKMNMQKFKELIPPNGVKQVLIAILIEVKQILNDNSHLYERKINGTSEFYLPTTIESNPSVDIEGPEYSVGEIAKSILQNADLDEFLYEVDVMITKFITANSLEKSVSKIDEVPEIDSEVDQERHKKFTKIKNIRMVDINQAKEDLN